MSVQNPYTLRRFAVSFLAATALPFASAHFVLQVPKSLGFSDIKETQAPCGGFDITSRSEVTSWPVDGYPIGVVSTHPNAHWQIRAALLEDTEKFMDLVPDIIQDGMGNFCLRSVPGIEDWVGKDAVLQIIQTAVDGQLYQCAAIEFVEGAAASVPGNCKNASTIVASYDPKYTGQATTPTATGTTTGAPAATTTGSSGANRSFDAPFIGVFVMGVYVLDYLIFSGVF